jgi:hypothetical protein
MAIHTRPPTRSDERCSMQFDVCAEHERPNMPRNASVTPPTADRDVDGEMSETLNAAGEDGIMNVEILDNKYVSLSRIFTPPSPTSRQARLSLSQRQHIRYFKQLIDELF